MDDFSAEYRVASSRTVKAGFVLLALLVYPIEKESVFFGISFEQFDGDAAIKLGLAATVGISLSWLIRLLDEFPSIHQLETRGRDEIETDFEKLNELRAKAADAKVEVDEHGVTNLRSFGVAQAAFRGPIERLTVSGGIRESSVRGLLQLQKESLEPFEINELDYHNSDPNMYERDLQFTFDELRRRQSIIEGELAGLDSAKRSFTERRRARDRRLQFEMVAPGLISLIAISGAIGKLTW